MASEQFTKHGFRATVIEVYKIEDEVSLSKKWTDEELAELAKAKLDLDELNGDNVVLDGETSEEETDLVEVWFYDLSTLTIDHSGEESCSEDLHAFIYTSPDGIIVNSQPYKEFIHIKSREIRTIQIPAEFNYIKIKFRNDDIKNATKFRYLINRIIKWR